LPRLVSRAGISNYSVEFKILAVDLRALQEEFIAGLCDIVEKELCESFGLAHKTPILLSSVCSVMRSALERTSTMDAEDQMREVAASSSTLLLKFFTNPEFDGAVSSALAAVPGFQSRVAERGAALLHALRGAFLSGERGRAPASMYLGKTGPLYEFIRVKLNIKLHGIENYSGFANGLGVDDVTIGQNITAIHEVSFRVSACASDHH
jgi:phenylalanine ammonia-lyase